MPPPPARESVDAILLHDLKNLVGVVHAAAVELGYAHAAGEPVSDSVAELVSLSGLVSEVLRGLSSEGRAVRPFDLRAAVLCARLEQRNLSVGALSRPMRADAEAGALTDLVIAVGAALGGNGELVFVREDARPGLLFEPAVPNADDARAMIDVLGPHAERVSCVMHAEDGSVRLAPA